MIDERELREMLERRARTISATPTDASVAIRRARRRLVLNAAVGTVVGLVVLVGALAGVRAIQTASPIPADPPDEPRPAPAAAGTLAYGLDGDIYVADWDGANAVKIADGRPPKDCNGWSEFWGEGSIWSPDGRYLAYRYADCSDPESFGGVVISDAEGNVLATFPTGRGWDIGWSPDSTRVAVWDSFMEKVGVYGVDGARKTQVTMPSGWEPSGDHDPAWHDGTLAVEDMELPLDGGVARQLDIRQRSVAQRAEWRDDYLATVGLRVDSPDGSLTAYIGRRRFLMVEGSDGSPSSRVRLLQVDPGTTLWINGFSPQGDLILFSRIEDQGAGMRSLWSINADGSDLRRLIKGTAWGDWLSPSLTG